jgi:hypothetical protein
LAGDAHFGGDVGDGAGVAALDETAAALDRQRGVTVEHRRVFLVALRGVTNVMTRNN